MNNDDLLRRIESADMAGRRKHYGILTEGEIESRKFKQFDLDGLWVSAESKAGKRTGRIFGLGLEKPSHRQTLIAAIEWLKHEKASIISVKVCAITGNEELPTWLSELEFQPKARMEQWYRTTEIIDPEPVTTKARNTRSRQLDSAIEIREISPDSANHFASIVGINYHLGKHTDLSWWARQVGMPGSCTFLAYLGEEPVGTGMLQAHKDEDICVLGYGTTLKDYRKRGIQNAMIATRVEKARELGYRYVAASTFGTDKSSRNLQRQGFLSAGADIVYRNR